LVPFKQRWQYFWIKTVKISAYHPTTQIWLTGWSSRGKKFRCYCLFTEGSMLRWENLYRPNCAKKIWQDHPTLPLIQSWPCVNSKVNVLDCQLLAILQKLTSFVNYKQLVCHLEWILNNNLNLLTE
jgi:hypothetical protein